MKPEPLRPNRKPSSNSRSAAARPRTALESSPPGPEEKALAKRFVNAVLAKNSSIRTSAPSVAKQIQALTEGNNRTTVLDVLAWYVEHLDDAFVPKAYCGETLRKKYPYIQDAFESANPFHGLVISEKAQEYGYVIWNMGWRCESLRAIFPALAQKSHQGILELRAIYSARLSEIQPSPPPPSKALLRSDSPDPELNACLVAVDHLNHDWNEVLRWWNEINRWGDKRKEWKLIHAYCPGPRNLNYVQQVRAVVLRYAGLSAAKKFDDVSRGG